MMRAPAPIVIFCFRRPDHLRDTLQSLQQCPEFSASPVIICCDGPRTREEHAVVEATRTVARNMLGSRAEYRFSEINLGLAESVIRGVTYAVERYGKVIVIEDDLSVVPAFLSYMNHALERYENDPEVFQISGYQFPVPQFTERHSALFLPITVSWGWATWRRAWAELDLEATGWQRLRNDRQLRHKFNLDGVYNYATMLLARKQRRNNSWAILWYWTVFCHNGIVLFPPRTLLRNTGMDGSGTHGRGLLRSFSALTEGQNEVGPDEFPGPQVIREDYAQVKTALSKINGRLLGAIVDRIKWYATLFRSL